MSLTDSRLRRLWMLAVAAGLLAPGQPAAAKERHLLYAASPGIRNYVEYGGVGVLVFDMDHGYKFVKRIPTWTTVPGKEAENVKGIAASAKTGMLYVSTLTRMAAIDLLTEKTAWDKAFEGGCDRMAISPDGKILYVPSFEGPHWTVVNAATGEVIAKVVPMSGGVGPFSNSIRPFTVNGSQTLCFVNVNGLLGFEVGDLRTGKMLHRVEVAGFKQGPVKRHGCPSHGIGMTPDEKELWVCDGANSRLHIFDATVMPPKQTATSIAVRDQPGWITFSIDGRWAFASTGEVIDARTKKIVAALKDETGREVHSEKVLEIVFDNDKPVRAGNQFGVGAKR